MNLERLAISLRPRSAWEAIDLGIRLCIANARGLYPAWLAVCLPLSALVLAVGWLTGLDDYALLLLWWLKPAMDRVALYLLSHAVFGDMPSIRQLFRALPQLRRPGLFRALSWGRISLQRSLHLPIEQLEQLSGKAATQRRKLISRRVGGQASWLTLAWLHLEVIALLSLLALGYLLLPPDLAEQVDWQFFGDDTHWLSYLPDALYVLCALLLEPLYVAAGFMLYLKRRNDLEAWDVELQFRQLGQAEPPASHRALAGLCLAALLACCLGLPGTPAQAQNMDPAREAAIASAAKALPGVMQAPEFGSRETERKLRWESDKTASPDTSRWWPDWLLQGMKNLGELVAWLAQFLASTGRVLGWALIALVAAALLYIALRNLRPGGWRGLRQQATPAQVAGFDIRPQSLPDDVAAAALQYLDAGQVREALSLLFRASVSLLAHHAQVPFARGDTEGDCLARVQQHAPQHAHYLLKLLGAWQALAYAHRHPGDAAVRALCTQWPQNFAALNTRGAAQ